MRNAFVAVYVAIAALGCPGGASGLARQDPPGRSSGAYCEPAERRHVPPSRPRLCRADHRRHRFAVRSCSSSEAPRGAQWGLGHDRHHGRVRVPSPTWRTGAYAVKAHQGRLPVALARCSGRCDESWARSWRHDYGTSRGARADITLPPGCAGRRACSMRRVSQVLDALVSVGVRSGDPGSRTHASRASTIPYADDLGRYTPVGPSAGKSYFLLVEPQDVVQRASMTEPAPRVHADLGTLA